MKKDNSQLSQKYEIAKRELESQNNETQSTKFPKLNKLPENFSRQFIFIDKFEQEIKIKVNY